MKMKEESNVFAGNAEEPGRKHAELTGEELRQVTGGAENGSERQPDRHNRRAPLTDAELTPPGGTEYEDGEKKAPNFYIELSDDISF